VAAVVTVVRSGPLLGDALRALSAASPTTIALLLASMLGSVFLTGCVFWILTRRFGPVPFGEMQALMAATTLANYLPLRPGLVGRVLYHRSRHGIRPVDALRTIVEAMLLTALALAALVPALLAAERWNAHPAIAFAAPAVLGAAFLVPVRTRVMAIAFQCRYAEALLTALRYHLAFELIGAPVPAATSAAIACVSMIANLVPFVSNGIGLREWAIGLLAPVLTGYALAQGLAAELVHRAAEVAVTVPTGLVGAMWLAAVHRRPPLSR
jgi:uncharacterized membrane protein YbhN (UPF0104 family)